jgi:hypothetical protein
MNDPLPFELLVVRTLYSIIDALPNLNKSLEVSLKQLQAYETDWHQRQSFEETH